MRVHVLAVLATMLFVLLGLVLVTTGVLGFSRRLPGNSYLGVRTPETRRSPDAWELANRAAGPSFVGSGLVLFAGAIGTGVIGGVTGWVLWVLAIPGALAMLAFTGIAGARAAAMWQEAQDLEDAPGCCGSSGAGATGEPATAAPAADCGVSDGCGSCSLKGMCETEDTATR